MKQSSACYLLMMDSCLAYLSTLEMEATCSSETSIDVERPILSFIQEYRALHNHRCGNLKSYLEPVRIVDVL
jgi:hypothetical protein